MSYQGSSGSWMEMTLIPTQGPLLTCEVLALARPHLGCRQYPAALPPPYSICREPPDEQGSEGGTCLEEEPGL